MSTSIPFNVVLAAPFLKKPVNTMGILRAIVNALQPALRVAVFSYQMGLFQNAL
jgi:hypothetical protein